MSEWISVDDKLMRPPPYEEVLIWPRPTPYCITGQYSPHHNLWHYYEYENGFGEISKKVSITHWMPLPEPPASE